MNYIALCVISTLAFGSAAMAGPAAAPDKVAVARLQMMDQNRDGNVSLPEFLALPTQVFNGLDKNGDGQVSPEEMAQDMRTQADNRAKAKERIVELNKERALSSKRYTEPPPGAKPPPTSNRSAPNGK